MVELILQVNDEFSFAVHRIIKNESDQHTKITFTQKTRLLEWDTCPQFVIIYGR